MIFASICISKPIGVIVKKPPDTNDEKNTKSAPLEINTNKKSTQ